MGTERISRQGAKAQRRTQSYQEFTVESFPCVFPLRLCAFARTFLLIISLLSATHSSLAYQPLQQDEPARAAAQKLFAEGESLLMKDTPASFEEALKKFTEALPLWQKAGDRRAEAMTLNNIGYIHQALDRKQLALNFFQRALPLLEAAGETHTRAVTLSFIGKTLDALGEKQRALESYRRALALFVAAGDKGAEAAALNNIGLVYDQMGEKQKALEFYNRALPILRATKNLRTEAITLVNIGLVYESIGEKQKALSRYQQALPILRAAGDRASEAITLNNIGLAYHRLGETAQALEYFEQARPLLRAVGNRRVEAVTLNNIGYVYDSLEEREKALDYYNQALPVLRAAGDRFYEAVTLNNIGLVYRAEGQNEKALEFFSEALKLRRAVGDRPGEAETLGDTGAVYAALGQPQKALEAYNESLRLSRTVEDRRIEASTLRRLALLEQGRGNLAQARAQIEAAISIVENVRTKLAAQELRDSYFASVQEHFETYISVLMSLHKEQPSQGFDALALSASERGRARSLLEMLTEARADIRQGISPALLERERSLQEKLTALAERQTRLLNEKGAGQEVAVLKKELAGVLDQYRQTEAEIRVASPRYAALTQPAPLSLNEIQRQALDADTLLLEYALGEEKSFLWMVTPQSIKSFELPGRREIERAAREVYQLLTARNRHIRFETPEERLARISQADAEYARASANLSRMLIGPLASGLKSQRLLIVGDGALNYIPFAALPVPSAGAAESNGALAPLMTRHEIVTLPSASTLVAVRREVAGRKPAPKTLAVIADPVFDKTDERVKALAGNKGEAARPSHHGEFAALTKQREATAVQQGAEAPIQRLPFTRREANEILSLVPLAQSKKALDFEANRQTATSAELGQYRYVHFATHGVLDSERPELSSIVLSLVNRQGREQDGFLWAHEVFNLRLPVEMVVLSGCRTGLGKEIKGEGLVGLTRGFMYAGAARVVVSLWDISDEASAELMAELYKGMLGQKHLRPAAALREAQLSVWRERRWQAPYYWAAFVLQGEVR